MKFGRVKFKVTNNGAGQYTAKAQAWIRNTRSSADSTPSYTAYGEGSTPEEAKSDAAASLQKEAMDESNRISRGESIS